MLQKSGGRGESEKHRTLVFWKPYGVLTQFTDESGAGRPTLKDYIAVPGVYAAGRLDHDSEGLLLLTSDGGLQHRLTDPRFGHGRTYWAQVEGVVTEEALKQLRAGVEVQGKKTLPAQARALEAEPELPARVPPIRERKAIPTAWIEVTLREGRNRQVRRMTAAVGLPTLRLVRVGLGGVTLEGLEPGRWRELTEEEVASLAAGKGGRDQHDGRPGRQATGRNRGANPGGYRRR